MKKRIIYYTLIIISIFTISGCNINDKKYIRNFSLPMSVQEKENLEIIKSNYEIETDENKSYFKCHYSNSSYVTIYLFRINPFTNNQIKLQSGKFDNPHRQVSNFQMLCDIFKDHFVLG